MTAKTVVWDISQAVIATNDGTGVLGSPVTVKGVVTLATTLRVKTGEQPGDGGIYEVRSKVTAVDGTLTFADHQTWDILMTITNWTRSGSGAYYALPANMDEFGYFAITGRTELENGGTYDIFIPRVKITSPIAMGMTDSSFTVPELTFTGVPDPNFLFNGKPTVFTPIRRNTSGVALTLPPANLVWS